VGHEAPAHPLVNLMLKDPKETGAFTRDWSLPVASALSILACTQWMTFSVIQENTDRSAVCHKLWCAMIKQTLLSCAYQYV
jgi:hypothetical protein